MTIHLKDIVNVVALPQITCEECREKVGMELLGDGMECGGVPASYSRGRCTNAKTLELHPCPFASEINEDHEPHCQCCSDCTHQCAMDV
jgi:hypothetical protein